MKAQARDPAAAGAGSPRAALLGVSGCPRAPPAAAEAGAERIPATHSRSSSQELRSFPPPSQSTPQPARRPSKRFPARPDPTALTAWRALPIGRSVTPRGGTGRLIGGPLPAPRPPRGAPLPASPRRPRPRPRASPARLGSARAAPRPARWARPRARGAIKTAARRAGPERSAGGAAGGRLREWGGGDPPPTAQTPSSGLAGARRAVTRALSSAACACLPLWAEGCPRSRDPPGATLPVNCRSAGRAAGARAHREPRPGGPGTCLPASPRLSGSACGRRGAQGARDEGGEPRAPLGPQGAVGLRRRGAGAALPGRARPQPGRLGGRGGGGGRGALQGGRGGGRRAGAVPAVRYERLLQPAAEARAHHPAQQESQQSGDPAARYRLHPGPAAGAGDAPGSAEAAAAAAAARAARAAAPPGRSLSGRAAADPAHGAQHGPGVQPPAPEPGACPGRGQSRSWCKSRRGKNASASLENAFSRHSKREGEGGTIKTLILFIFIFIFARS